MVLIFSYINSLPDKKAEALAEKRHNDLITSLEQRCNDLIAVLKQREAENKQRDIDIQRRHDDLIADMRLERQQQEQQSERRHQELMKALRRRR